MQLIFKIASIEYRKAGERERKRRERERERKRR